MDFSIIECVFDAACAFGLLGESGIGTDGEKLFVKGNALTLAEQIIKFSGFEPYKEMDIKFIGARRGERLTEPLWLTEENPTPTQYKKILKLKNITPATFSTDELLQKLYPVCYFSKENSGIYRDRELLVKILREAVPSLDEFYREEEENGDKRIDMATSVKVVL